MRIIKLTESDLEKIIKKVLKEDPQPLPDMENAPLGKVEAIQQALIDAGYNIGSTGVDGVFGRNTRNAVIKYQKANGIKQTGNVGPVTAGKLGVQPLTSGKPAQTPQKQTQTPQKQTQKPIQKPIKTTGQQSVGCPSVGNSPYFRNLSDMVSFWKKQFPNFKTDQEVISFIDRMINRDAEMFKQTIPAISQQGACEVASVGRRPQYDNKNIFIIDSPNKRIFLFSAKNKNGARSLVAQDIMQDGKNKQRNDSVSIANSFKTYGEVFRKLENELKRTPTESEVWGVFDKEKSRFLPAGIYQGTQAYADQKNYAGEGKNVLAIKNWLGKEVGQALHGYYKGDNRVPFMEKALSIVKNPNNPKEIEKFTEEMKNSGLKMDFSYGCINVPPRFVKYLSQYGPNSFIFNIAEDNKNYLAQNTENYFEKMQNSESCPSPKSLGAVDVSSIA